MPVARHGIVLVVLAFLSSTALGVRFVFDASPGTDAALRAMPLDDAYIHLVYARALVEQGTFAYNPGQPETGATSPLWAIAEAGLFVIERWLTLPTIEAAKLLGVLCAAVQALLAGLLAYRLAPSRIAALLATGLVALDPALAFASVSGMELPLAGVVVLGGTLAWLAGRFTLAAFLYGLAPLARPELAVFLVLLPLGQLPTSWRVRESGLFRGGRDAAVQLVLLALPTILWVWFCLHTTGRPLPNTFYGKHQRAPLLEQLEDLPGALAALSGDVPMLCWGAGFLLAAIGALQIARSPSSSAARAQRYALAAMPLLLLLGIAWAHRLVQPLAFYWYRYTMLVLPWLAVWIAVGCVTIADSARGATRAVQRRAGLLALASYGVCVALSTGSRIPQKAALFAWNCQNILEAQVTIGRWLAAHVPVHESVASADAGAVRYYSQRRTIDMLGLNHHGVQQEGLHAVLQREPAAAFVVFADNSHGVLQSPDLTTVFETYSPHYSICRCPYARMVVRAPAPLPLLTGSDSSRR